MKKLALLLGSLLVVGTAVQAKEVVVAPVEVSKEVIVVAEPVVEEVVVAVAPEFRPTGYVGLEYKAYGNTEGHGDKKSSKDDWN
ncbi:MAG: major outer membrane protein FomA, partial [Cetobacterium sp.]